MVVADDPDLPSHSVFAGRYRIVGALGEGDRKRTYLADDLVVPRQVAVAVIKPAAARADPSGTRREAEALAKAGTHPNVVTFYDWGVAEDAEYLVFDYLAGGTLRDYFAKQRQREKILPAEDVMRLGRQLARALAHVHRLGMIHRDVAPGNVWLDKRLIAHLGDFDSAISRNAALDPVGLPPTTEAYAAPEQVAGEPFDARSDLYSLGAVLYEALSGEMPNHCLDPLALRRRTRAGVQDCLPAEVLRRTRTILCDCAAERLHGGR
jgi:eukaryotic-like serine/threonine-protein kinase